MTRFVFHSHRRARVAFVAMLCVSTWLVHGICAAQSATPLPQGVRAVWEVNKAHRETTPTRERICLNGLWQWQPANSKSDLVPDGSWGYFKVPGSWPGIGDYMQKDCQTVFAHP
ncbi:MAG: hypothetical protein ACRDGM_17505, partial [bacterium]